MNKTKTSRKEIWNFFHSSLNVVLVNAIRLSLNRPGGKYLKSPLAVLFTFPAVSAIRFVCYLFFSSSCSLMSCNGHFHFNNESEMYVKKNSIMSVSIIRFDGYLIDRKPAYIRYVNGWENWNIIIKKLQALWNTLLNCEHKEDQEQLKSRN